MDVVYFLICYNKLAVCYLHFQIWKCNHVAKKTSDGAGNMSRPVLNKPPGQPNLFEKRKEKEKTKPDSNTVTLLKLSSVYIMIANRLK